MANCYKIYDLCKSCDGTGTTDDGHGVVTCTLCNGDKLKLTGYCTEAISDIPEVT